MPFVFAELELPGLTLVEPKVFPDQRGFFLESYSSRPFSERGIPNFVQDNHSRSQRGVIRGLHYQKDPYAQGKLVRVLQGEIYDVAVDLRRGSPGFGHWTGVYLSSDNFKMLYLPPGFGHGFCVTSDTAEVFYKVTADYAPGLERGIRFDDPELAIPWPVESPLLSPKDQVYPGFREADFDFSF